ncbi:MAG: sigma-70 family RNA polymerase sigma factor [Candidatus Desantisbacteria bacterium]
MIQNHEDNVLIDKCLNENKEAFAELVDKYKKPIVNLAYRMTWNIDDANDIAQDTFLNAYKNLRQFNRKYSFFSWIYTICQNRCKDVLKKKKLATVSTDDPLKVKENEISYDIPDTSLNPEKMIVQKETMREMFEAINSLPGKYQEVITLRHIQDLSYEEIAEILYLSVSNVKTRIHRARKILQIKLRKILID